jgi:prepilin-type N-terminal cleavage/methylation domain-containing protein
MRCLLFFHNRVLRQDPLRKIFHNGFTLLELLLVISLLGIVASLAVAGYENVQDQARYDAARYEMTEIRNAILQFRRDSGSQDFPGQGAYDCTDASNGGAITDPNTLMSFPVSGTNAEIITWCQHPANFWMLFENPFTTGGGWNIDTHRGWNGPYLHNNRLTADVNAGYDSNGTYIASANMTFSLRVVTDAYGSPYFLFDLDNPDTNNPARLVSLGQNLSYDGADTSDCKSPTISNENYPLDHVLCLLE